MESKKATTTDINYINKNSQMNLGRLDEKGTGNNQWFYLLECQLCKHQYKSNGADIHERKCPNCQKGSK